MKKLVTTVMSCAVAFAACAGMSVSAEKADTYSAWLVGTIGGNQIWEKADAQVTSITGNGSYTVNWKLDQGSDSVSCLILKTDINLYDYAPEDVTAEKLLDESSAKIVIDSVSVDGAPISYKMSDGAFTVDDDGSTIRVNLMNEWGQKVNIYDVPAKTNIAESISVSFTVSIAASAVDRFQILDCRIQCKRCLIDFILICICFFKNSLCILKSRIKLCLTFFFILCQIKRFRLADCLLKRIFIHLRSLLFFIQSILCSFQLFCHLIHLVLCSRKASAGNVCKKFFRLCQFCSKCSFGIVIFVIIQI